MVRAIGRIPDLLRARISSTKAETAAELSSPPPLHAPSIDAASQDSSPEPFRRRGSGLAERSDAGPTEAVRRDAGSRGPSDDCPAASGPRGSGREPPADDEAGKEKPKLALLLRSATGLLGLAPQPSQPSLLLPPPPMLLLPSPLPPLLSAPPAIMNLKDAAKPLDPFADPKTLPEELARLRDWVPAGRTRLTATWRGRRDQGRPIAFS